ncbi:hypothetical protein [Microlunatus soli]|uniref:Uncharacterized protein n=1 Tax=Microlunatus soli TaxID=630515 RepID=A0A1H1TUZ3_9ACTN|nr:hypothetical protein [Microlunatus soli]SDS64018.1 hypothetical protein SAMN04489812_2532 [Microlunatus soli]
MADPYRVILQHDLAARLRGLRKGAAADPGGADARLLTAGLKAARALRAGRERDFAGERLGYSPRHYDLRDCAEIKVPVVQDFTPSGKPMGPSHRMIYREFEPAPDSPLPIRQVLAFEHRANGLPFAVAAAALDRTKGRGVDALKDLPATRPAIGKNKDPDRPITPPRQSLPPEIAAAVRTSNAKRTTVQNQLANSRTAANGARPPHRDRVRPAPSAARGRPLGR